MNTKIKLYIFGGIFSVIIDIGLLAFFHSTIGINIYISALLAFVGSSLFGYIYHRNISFKDQAKKSHTTQFSQFIVVNGATQVLYMILLYVGVDLLSINYIIVAIISKAILFIINYVLHNMVTFRKGSYVKYIISLLIGIVLIWGGYYIIKSPTPIKEKALENIGSEGVTWYQIIPDKRANGDTKNDDITPLLDRASISGSTIDEYKKQETNWTGDRFSMSSGENIIYNDVINQLKYTKQLAYAQILRARWYGGDFAGMRNHIPYLQEMGIGGILLNPIWIANSSMRYDVIDYRHIDPRLSSNDKKTNIQDILKTGRDWTNSDKDFMQLVNDMHAAGIKVVIDVAFTYSTVNSIFLEDIARNGKKSKYYSWFEVFYKGDKDYDQRECKLSDFYTGEQYQEAQNIRMNGRWRQCPMVYVNRGYDMSIHPELEARYKAIIDRWMKPQTIDGKQYEGIDGIRVDAINELPILLRKNLHEHVKAIKPDAIVVGEDWSNNFSLIEDKQLDGMTNYFTRTLSELFFIAKDQPLFTGDNNFTTLLGNEYGGNNRKYWNNIFNQLGSHDTDRIYSKLHSTNRYLNSQAIEKIPLAAVNNLGQHIWDSPNINKVEYSAPYIQSKPNKTDITLRKTLTMLQFMLPGPPLIYYGDEIGMRGADDPDNRKPMWRSDYKYEPQTVCKVDKTEYCIPETQKENIFINNDLLDEYKTLINLRKNSNALQIGDVDSKIDIDKKEKDGVLSFARGWKDEKIYFISNQNTGYQNTDITLNTGAPFSEWYNPLTKQSYKANIRGSISTNIAPEDSIILRSK